MISQYLKEDKEIITLPSDLMTLHCQEKRIMYGILIVISLVILLVG